MLIREYTPGDLDAMRRLHAAQGFAYPLPDLDSPLFVTKLVLEDDDPNCDLSGSGPSTTGTSGAGPGIDGICDFSLRNLDLASSDPHRLRPAPPHGPRDIDHGGEAGSREVATGSEGPSPNSARIVMAVLLRLTAEAYMLHDPAAGTPRRRWRNFLVLHDAALHAAAARGLDDAQAFLPPPIARAFGRRLSRLGWVQDPWPCFSRSV